MPIKILAFLSMMLIFLSGCSTPQTQLSNLDKTLSLPELALPECGTSQQSFGDFRISGQNQDDGQNDLDQFVAYEELTLPWPQHLENSPESAKCFVHQSAQVLDTYIASDYPVTNAISHSALLLGRQIDSNPVPNISRSADSFGRAVTAICEKAEQCQNPVGHLPPKLAGELAPIMWAIFGGIEAREKMDKETSKEHPPEWWHKNGGNLLFSYGEMNLPAPDPQNIKDRKYMFGSHGRQALYNASARIAFAVEQADFSSFRNTSGISFSMETSVGWIIVADSQDHAYPADDKDILFFLDLGGNDNYQNPIASNTSWQNPVSIAIDLDGNDAYGYEAKKYANTPEGLLADDEAGRYGGDSFYGRISLSRDYRQGAGRNGIAMLFDYGEDSDTYQSLRCSQGCAYFGVGVLFDDGGEVNSFVSEDMSQGSAQFGIGINIVAGGVSNDFASFAHSQGFGHIGGVGILLNGGAKGEYTCDIGDPNQSGVPVYYSAHLPGKANASLCQGAGSGQRAQDILDRQAFLPGGIGILRHIGDNSKYICSTLCQGAGTWHGTGVLSNSGSKPVRNYIQSAHGYSEYFGLGIYANNAKGE
jgi:hypothetical protein